MSSKQKTDRNDTEAGTADAPESIEVLLNRRRDCLKRLTEIAAGVEQQWHRAQADFIRAITEAQLVTQTTQRESFQNYVAAMQKAGPTCASTGAGEAAQRCGSDLKAAERAAQESVTAANLSISTALKDRNDIANREWDETCYRYVESLRDWFTHLDLKTVEPAGLGVLGESLVWVASKLRKRKDS